MDKGDILIDGGNSYFKDTRRRSQELEAKGFRLLGVGVSGGEEGALNGPSLMPGGNETSYKEVEKFSRPSPLRWLTVLAAAMLVMTVPVTM